MRGRVAEATTAAKAAVVANWRPFVLIQACAVALVVAYYTVPGAIAATAWLAQTKLRGGLLFSGLSSAFAGAALPAVAKRLTGLGRERFNWADFLFQVVVFATLGVTIDLFYQLMALIFGAVATPSVVLKKVLVDQLLFSPLYTIPFSTTAFLWKDAGFSLRRTVEASRDGVWPARYASLLISCWAFWGPVLACVYAMPVNLQFCLFLCAQAAWGLLLLAMSGR